MLSDWLQRWVPPYIVPQKPLVDVVGGAVETKVVEPPQAGAVAVVAVRYPFPAAADGLAAPPPGEVMITWLRALGALEFDLLALQ